MNHVIYTLESDYVEPIHRLDQETVGLLIVAKNPLMKKFLIVCWKKMKLLEYIRLMLSHYYH